MFEVKILKLKHLKSWECMESMGRKRPHYVSLIMDNWSWIIDHWSSNVQMMKNENFLFGSRDNQSPCLIWILWFITPEPINNILCCCTKQNYLTIWTHFFMNIFYFLILWCFVTTPDKLTINLTTNINFFGSPLTKSLIKMTPVYQSQLRRSKTALMRTWLWRRSKSNPYPFLKCLRSLNLVVE